MNNTDLYIEKYIELEHTVKEIYNLKESDSIYYYLNQQEKYKIYKNRLAYCQKVRNFLHHEYKINNEFAIIPSDEMIQFITDLTKEIRSQSTCKNIMVKDIYFQTLNGNIVETLQIMKENDYSHIPILHESKVIGIFNKTTLLDIYDSLNEKMTFKDIQSHLSIDPNHYQFVSKDCFIEDLEHILVSNYKIGKRIDLLLVSEKGDNSSELIRIVTPWLILQQ